MVVREFAFADVAADFALSIGGGDAAVGQQAGGRATVERAVGVFHAENAAEDRRVGDLDVGQEGFRPVAAMEEGRICRRRPRSCCSVHERGGRAAGELHGATW